MKLLPPLLLAAFGAASLVAQAPRTNLALNQQCVADSEANGDFAASYATDGTVNNVRRWQSSGAGPHWLEVRLAEAVEIGSAHLVMGVDNIGGALDFSLQHLVGGNWVDIPGTVFTTNRAVQLRIPFTAPVTTDRIRFHTTAATAIVRELALYAPSAVPIPWATDYTLNLARASRRITTSSDRDRDHLGRKAIDGYVDDTSLWITAFGSGPHTFDVDLHGQHRVGSVHLHSGLASGMGAVRNLNVLYPIGSSWVQAPGAQLRNNTATSVEIRFSLPVLADRIRLEFPDDGYQRVREICVFPYHDAAGYPLGTDAVFARPPGRSFAEHHDDFYRLRCRDGGLAIRGGGAWPELWTPGVDREALFQVLLQVGTDCFSLRNRATGRHLEVAGGSRAAGAQVIESQRYGGMPHQLWRLGPLGGGWHELVNVHSGLALTATSGGAGATLQQDVSTGGNAQQWAVDFATHFPKKGLAGWEGQSWQVGSSWVYNWGEGTGSSLPFESPFAPMFWGDWGWGNRPGLYPGWRRASAQTQLMTFNEPDNSSQSNMSVDRSLDLWSLLEESRLPLVSPGMTHPSGSWSQSFMDQARDRDLRVDYFAAHWYAAPNADSLMSNLQGWANRYGKPVWLTEWSNVDWGGGGGWTFADCYEFFAEILHRMELADFVRRYSVFIFRGPASGTTSHFYYAGTTDLTPVGEVYAAWDGVTELREDVAYHVHCKGSDRHLLDLGGTTRTPFVTAITSRDAPTEWALRPAGSGRYFLDNLATGRRLATDGINLSLLDASVVDFRTQWSAVPDSHGWFYLQHALGSRLRNDPSGALAMLGGASDDSARWRFIKAYAPASTNFGIGCGAASLDLTAVPRGGASAIARVSGARPGASAFVLVSGSRATTPLTAFGMGGCYANVAFGPATLATLAGTTGANGQFDAVLPIPKGFTGSVYAQAFVTEPNLNQLALSASKGVPIHVR